MVRIINYRQRQAEEDRNFFALELQGGIEMVKSQETNQFYATAKRAYITSTFDEETCKALIGTSMPGKIEKQECEGYHYTVKETGEMIVLTHRYVYMPEAETPSNEDRAVQKLFADEHAFSQNGVLEEELMD